MSDDELEDCCQCAHLRASLGALRALHTAERERAGRAETNYARLAGDYSEEASYLRERVARLVGALQDIAQLDYTRGAVNMAATKANAIARTALEGK